MVCLSLVVRLMIVLMQVIHQEGWQRLYGGLAPSMFGTAASQVLAGSFLLRFVDVRCCV